MKDEEIRGEKRRRQEGEGRGKMEEGRGREDEEGMDLEVMHRQRMCHRLNRRNLVTCSKTLPPLEEMKALIPRQRHYGRATQP